MKKVYLGILFVLFALCLLGCNSKNTVTADSLNKPQIAAYQFPNSNTECQEWQQIYDGLSSQSKKDLETEGITIGGKGYVLSAELMPDCRLRVEIGRYIREIINGTDGEGDTEFAAQNSKEIVRVLRRTWNYYSDGASHEKYGFLTAKGIKDEDIAPLVGELLEKEGINYIAAEGAIFYTLLTRRLSGLNAALLKSLEQAETEEDATAQVYALYLLHRDTSEPKYLAKLKAISKKASFPNGAKNELDKLVIKVERRDKIDFEDFENFSYAVTKARNDKNQNP